MVSVDEHTKVGVEIVSQGVKLSEELILMLLKKINSLFADKEKQNDFVIKDNTKEGEQKIQSLIRKHKDGVNSLDDNLTKEQVNDYKTEFKKLGIDFSVVKNEKDNYSFFFAGKDTNLLEKGLKNIVEKKSLENVKKKELSNSKEKDLKSVFSLKSVKEIDSEIKGKESSKDQVKKISQNLSR